MPQASSINSYPDIRKVLDQAMTSAKGLRLRFPTHEESVLFKGRVHSFRSIDRKENRKIYPEHHPMYGRSVYDPLMVKTEDSTTVIIIKLDEASFNIEEIV
jgi:hypothetical protein